jgi:Ulp1 family protease
MQENGYDCGVFVTRFAKMIVDKWPSSTKTDIDQHFRSHFMKEFTQEDIDNERDNIASLLDQ